MAITIHKEPVVLQPVYNDIIFVSSSDNINQPNFKFVSEVIVNNAVIAKIKYPANPEGYGVLDIHKHLQTQLSDNFNNFEPNLRRTISDNIENFSWDSTTTYLSIRNSSAITGVSIGDTIYFTDTNVGLSFSGTVTLLQTSQVMRVGSLSVAPSVIVSNYVADFTAGTLRAYFNSNQGGSNNFSEFLVEQDVSSLGYKAGIGAATGAYVGYTVTFAEEFRPQWDFKANVASGNNISFLSDVDPNTFFNVGDVITITQNPGYTNPSYNGNAIITAIVFNGQLGDWQLVINKAKAVATAGSEGGVMNLSNYRNQSFDIEIISDYKIAFNGVKDFVDYLSWDSDIYYDKDLQPPNPLKFLTTLPVKSGLGTVASPYLLEYNLRRNSYLQLNAQNLMKGVTSVYGKSWISLKVEGDNANYFIREVTGSVSSADIFSFGLGVEQINNSEDVYVVDITTTPPSYKLATQPIISSTAKSYTVFGKVEPATGGIDIGGYKIVLEDACSKYEDIQLVFMDKLGSFVPYHFDMVNKQNKTVSRTNYQTDYGNYASSANNWTHNSYDRGVSNLDVVVTDVFTINSNWVSQAVSNFLMELVSSPQVFWKKESGELVAVNLTIGSVERKQVINDQLVNYTFTFELSSKNNMQTG